MPPSAWHSCRDAALFPNYFGQICYLLLFVYDWLLLQMFSHLKPGLDQSVRDLPLHIRYRLAEALDPQNAEGRDWEALASSLGLRDRVLAAEESDADEVALSRLDALLDAWSTETNASIKDLHGQLVKLGRPDAVEILLSLAPLFRFD